MAIFLPGPINIKLFRDFGYPRVWRRFGGMVRDTRERGIGMSAEGYYAAAWCGGDVEVGVTRS